MLSMYAKCPAKCRRGIHFASILPRRPSFSVRIPQIMHSGQILPLFFDLSFVRELYDSCLRGSSGRDQHRGSTFTGILACPLREGANAVARPFVGVLASWFILHVEAKASWFALCWGVSAAAHPLCGGTSVVICPLREGASAVARPLCGAQASPFALYAKVQALRLVPYVGVPTLWFAFCAGMPARQEKTARRRKALSLARPSRSAFLSGKSWHYFVAMHSQKGASVRQRKATGRGTPSRTRRRLRGR